MSNAYLLNYANVAYREDNRRKPNGWQFSDILDKNGVAIGNGKSYTKRACGNND